MGAGLFLKRARAVNGLLCSVWTEDFALGGGVLPVLARPQPMAFVTLRDEHLVCHWAHTVLPVPPLTLTLALFWTLFGSTSSFLPLNQGSDWVWQEACLLYSIFTSFSIPRDIFNRHRYHGGSCSLKALAKAQAALCLLASGLRSAFVSPGFPSRHCVISFWLTWRVVLGLYFHACFFFSVFFLQVPSASWSVGTIFHQIWMFHAYFFKLL